MGLCRSMEGGGSSQGGYQPGVDLSHLLSSAVFVRGIFTGKCMWCAEGMVQKPWWQMSLYDRHYVLPKYPCSWQLQVLGCSCCSGIRSAYGDFCSSGISRTCRASVTPAFVLQLSHCKPRASWSCWGTSVGRFCSAHVLQQGLSWRAVARRFSVVLKT